MRYIIFRYLLNTERANCSKGQDAKSKPKFAKQISGRGTAEVLSGTNKAFLGVKLREVFFSLIG